MRDDVWRQIDEDLEQLHKDTTLLRFHPFIVEIKRWAATEPPVYDPDIFRTLMDLIRQMGKDVKQGKPVQAVLEQAASRSGAYNQPFWDVNNVYQAHGNIFQIILNKWRDEIEPNRIRLPIVLLVMIEKDAFELNSGVAFQGYPNELREDFKRLQQLLNQRGITNWIGNYDKQKSKEWRPFKESPESIEQLINRALLRIEDLQMPIEADFIDIHTLNESQNRHTLRQLRKEGCVVILDVISMQHPVIQHEFRHSLLDVFPTTIVARVAPVADALSIEQHMVVVIEKHIEVEFYKRFHMDWDDKCQEVTNPSELARWLKNQVPKLLPDDAKTKTDPRRYWFNMSRGDI